MMRCRIDGLVGVSALMNRRDAIRKVEEKRREHGGERREGLRLERGDDVQERGMYKEGEKTRLTIEGFARRWEEGRNTREPNEGGKMKNRTR